MITHGSYLEHIKQEHKKAREDLDACMAIADYFSYGKLKSRYEFLAYCFNWLSDIDDKVTVKHVWDAWEERFDVTLIYWHFPAATYEIPLVHKTLELKSLNYAWTYFNYSLRDKRLNPSNTISYGFVNQYYRNFPELYRWLAAFNYADQMLWYYDPKNFSREYPAAYQPALASHYEYDTKELCDHIEKDTETFPDLGYLKRQAEHDTCWEETKEILSRAVSLGLHKVVWNPLGWSI